jgi:hypothetical protein
MPMVRNLQKADRSIRMKEVQVNRSRVFVRESGRSLHVATLLSRAVAQAVSRRLPTEGARVRARVKSCA